MSRQVGEYTLVSDEKLERAINGTMSRDGRLSGGVGKDASDEVLLAKYDELGGLIKKGALKVKNGSFFDTLLKKPRPEPQVVFEMSMNGRILEVNEAKAQAIQLAKEELASLESGDEEEEVTPKRRGRKKRTLDE